MYRLSFFLLFIGLSISCFSQEEEYDDYAETMNKTDSIREGYVTKGDIILKDEKIIKLNIAQLFIQNIVLQYEHSFHKNWSGALGASILLPITIPADSLGGTVPGISQTDPRITGWTITPELRFYPGKKIKHQAPYGFYVAPYFRYSSYNMTTSLTDDSTRVSLDITERLKGYSLGVMVGTQLLIGKRISLDWWILGAGKGKGKYEVELVLDGDGISLTQAEQDRLAEDLTEDLAALEAANGKPYGTPMPTTTTANSISAGLKDVSIFSIRGFGMTFGFRF